MVPAPWRSQAGGKQDLASALPEKTGTPGLGLLGRGLPLWPARRYNPPVMSPDAESDSDWLEPARQNAARFAALLKADAADLQENQATPDAAQGVAKIQQIQCLLEQIIAALNEDVPNVPEQEINHT